MKIDFLDRATLEGDIIHLLHTSTASYRKQILWRSSNNHSREQSPSQ